MLKNEIIDKWHKELRNILSEYPTNDIMDISNDKDRIRAIAIRDVLQDVKQLSCSQTPGAIGDAFCQCNQGSLRFKDNEWVCVRCNKPEKRLTKTSLG